MSFNQKIISRMQQMNLTKAQLAKAADIPYTTLDSMLKRDSDQKRMLSMIRIASILKTSVEELVGEPDANATDAPLTSAERALIQQYRALDARAKKTVNALISHEVAVCATPAPAPVFEKKEIARRFLKVYDFPAAAGVPLPLFSEDYTLTPADDAPRGAEFGIRISGDSMEPKIKDGSTVWVQGGETLSDGEIGIFLLNGEALCKKLSRRGSSCLLKSENPRYSPISILPDDDLRVVGKVLF